MAAVCGFVGLLAWTILMQSCQGAYSAEFSGHPDEPAHYVTGLMVRDYLASGFAASPMKFAENYYLHYPKVAFGMWGPLPHLAEGVWMLLFSESRASILIWMALITTTLAFIVAKMAGNDFGWIAGAAAGLAFVAVRYVRVYGSMVMADNLCALMELAGLIYFGRFLDSQKRRDAVLFGLFACLAVFTKGNGLALALVPPLAVLLTRRFSLLRRADFWIPAIMVLVFVGPWQYVSQRLLHGSGFRSRDWSFAVAYVSMLLNVVGLWLVPVVLIGIYDRVIRPLRTGAIEGRWAAAAVFIPAFWIFHVLVPSAGAEQRYIVATVGPILMFFVAGASWIAKHSVAGLSAGARGWAVGAAGVLVFAVTAFATPRKASFGFTEVGQALFATADLRDSIMLVSSEGDGEGMLIAEVAMRDQRPGDIILRASKVLAQSDWDGNNYSALRPTPEETMAYLDSVPVRILILDRSWVRQPLAHHRSLIMMLTMFPGRWQLMGAYPQQIPPAPGHGRIEVYRRIGREDQPRSKIRLDLRHTLGRYIEK